MGNDLVGWIERIFPETSPPTTLGARFLLKIPAVFADTRQPFVRFAVAPRHATWFIGHLQAILFFCPSLLEKNEDAFVEYKAHFYEMKFISTRERERVMFISVNKLWRVLQVNSFLMRVHENKKEYSETCLSGIKFIHEHKLYTSEK